MANELNKNGINNFLNFCYYYIKSDEEMKNLFIEINKNEIVSQCEIKDILRIKPIYGSSFLEWDNINVITKQGDEILFYIKYRNILHKIVKFIKEHLMNI